MQLAGAAAFWEGTVLLWVDPTQPSASLPWAIGFRGAAAVANGAKTGKRGEELRGVTMQKLNPATLIKARWE